MWKIKTFVRNALIHVATPLESLRHIKRPLRRVLSFHDIPPALQDSFVKKIQWLKAHYTIVSLDDLCEKRNLNPNHVNLAITFDDGFKEQFSFARVVLKGHAIPATFFVPSGSLNLTGVEAKNFARNNLKRTPGEFEFMTSEELQELSRDPLFTVGGHTTHHRDLGARYDETALRAEIIGDKLRLEELIGKKIRWFAYPFGSINNSSQGARAVIREAGYVGAFTIVPSFWDTDTDPYLLGRDSLSLDSTQKLWASVFRGGYDTISRIKNHL